MQRLTDLPAISDKDPFVLMVAYYIAPLMARLGFVVGCPDSRKACIAAGRRWMRNKFKSLGIVEVDGCHVVGGRPISCLAYGTVRYDGHIMYSLTPNGIRLLNLTHMYEAKLPVSDAKYISLASSLDVAYFSDVLFGANYGVVYIPTEDSIYYIVASSKGDLSILGSLTELHRSVVETVKKELTEHMLLPHSSTPYQL